MRCSDCGKVVRPIVAVDLDGTMADYHGHFLKFAAKYLGTRVPQKQYTGTPAFREWFVKLFMISNEEWYDIKLAYRQGGMKRSQPMYPFANHFANKMVQADIELWITTTRPYLRLDGVDPDTRFWLKLHQISYYGLLYDEDKYVRLAQNVDPTRVIAVIDDLPEQYDSAARMFGDEVPILRRNPYNTNINRPNETTTLLKAAILVEERAREWRGQHGGE